MHILGIYKQINNCFSYSILSLNTKIVISYIFFVKRKSNTMLFTMSGCCVHATAETKRG